MSNTTQAHTSSITESTLYEKLSSLYGQDKVDQQFNLEIESQELGRETFTKRINDKITQGAGADAGETKHLLQSGIVPLKEGLDAWKTLVNNGRAGRKSKAIEIINTLETDLVAFVTIRTVLNSLLQHGGECELAELCTILGANLASEQRFSKVLQTLSPREQKQALAGLDKRVGLSFKAAYLRAYEKHLQEDGSLSIHREWSMMDKANTGLKMIELMCIHTGLIKINTVSSTGKAIDKRNIVQFARGVDQYISEADKAAAELFSVHLPMVIPPKPWTEVYGGGYYLNIKNPCKFIRASDRVLKDFYNDVDMPNVFNAVNAIQSTAWQINKRVLGVAKDLLSWQHIPEALDMPEAEPDDKPIRTTDADSDTEKHKAWKRDMVRYYQKDNRRKSRRIRLNAILALAYKFEDEQAIYFPHNVDFRGRIYPLTQLNPQGDDFMKSLLQFSNGLPLGEHGAKWLAMQGANSYGLDKATMDVRIQWVHDNSELITNIASDPLTYLEWTEVDSPWEFLAFCFEWADYLKQGDSYVSHIAVNFDGSCSGLQHYSAILRDEVGGEAVNLLPSKKVKDIYRMNSDLVLQKVQEDAINGTEDSTKPVKGGEEGEEMFVMGTKSMAKEWLSYGITRKVTKRSVMTLCYGSRQFGFANHVLEDIIYPANSKSEGRFSHPAQEARYLAKYIWEAVSVTVVKAVEAMEWLQKAAGLLASDKDMNGNPMPIHWVTPAGFPVRQEYKNAVTKRINTVLSGGCRYLDPTTGDTEGDNGETRLRLTIGASFEGINANKQRNGIAPNFVHSMDASHLMLTVLNCHKLGVKSFAMIHDSYGTPAGDAQVMYEQVRSTFVETYTEHDVLQELHDVVAYMLSPDKLEELPEIPSKGNLDINSIKESIYAFS